VVAWLRCWTLGQKVINLTPDLVAVKWLLLR